MTTVLPHNIKNIILVAHYNVPINKFENLIANVSSFNA